MAEITKLIKEIQELTGWKGNNQTIMGQRGGYWYTVSNVSPIQPILVSTAVSEINPKMIEQLKIRLTGSVRQHKISRIESRKHIISLVLRPEINKKKTAQRINDLIDDLVVEMSSLGFVNECVACSADSPIDAVEYGNNVGEMCANCKVGLLDEFQEAIEKNAVEGNYFTGAAGALAGAIIGIGIWLLFSFLGYFTPLAGFIIALLTQSGYLISKGKARLGMPLIVMGLIVFSILAANVIDLRLNSDNVDLNWLNIALGILFAFLGSWRTFMLTKGEERNRHYEIEKIR